MSEKERVIQLLEALPAYKIAYVLAYVQGLSADESADDDYCEQLLNEYETNPDKNNFISLEDAAKCCGVDLNEL